MRKALLGAALTLLSSATQAASFICGAGQVSIVCPQTITEASSPTWSGSHTFLNPVVGSSSITASAFFGDGSGLTGIPSGLTTDYQLLEASTFTFRNLLKSTDTLIQMGSVDVFGRTQILNAKPLSVLRLGYNTADGDPFNSPSEGIVVNAAPSVARIKGDRIGLTESFDTSRYWFRADKTKMFFGNFGGHDNIYADNTSSFTAIGTRTKIGNEVFRVVGNALFSSSVTASAFFGDGSNLTGITSVSTGTPGVNTDRTLSDSGGIVSLDWENLILGNVVPGSPFLNFGTGKVYQPGGQLVLDWSANELIDTSSMVSVAWEARTLNNIEAGPVIYWGGPDNVQVSTNLVVLGSATATNFFGDGSGLTNVPGPAVSTSVVLTSGSSATWTTWANVRQLHIILIGGGGGGGGFNASTGDATTGSTGTATVFNDVVANPGGGGGSNTTDIGRGGAGGSDGYGVAFLRTPGNAGTKSAGAGAGSFFGGGAQHGSANTASPALPNTGAGGGGGQYDTNVNLTGGGGAGERVELYINNPGASFTYTIGSGGAGGSEGTVGTSSPGGTGGSGLIVIEGRY